MIQSPELPVRLVAPMKKTWCLAVLEVIYLLREMERKPIIMPMVGMTVLLFPTLTLLKTVYNFMVPQRIIQSKPVVPT